MNSMGRNSEKSGYLVIALLVVGLTAFSHSMKELMEIHQLTWDASRLVAQWSGDIATPAEIPQIPQPPQTVVQIEKLESCENHQSAPSVELPPLNEETEPSAVTSGRNQQRKTPRIERRVITIPSEAEIARKLQRITIDADEFEVRIPNVPFPDAGEPGATELPSFTFKAKARKHGAVKINPRDREILLKTLNRSINLRIAS